LAFLRDLALSGLRDELKQRVEQLLAANERLIQSTNELVQAEKDLKVVLEKILKEVNR
jgi:hypothetical protein